jgi:N utilization substance protein B
MITRRYLRAKAVEECYSFAIYENVLHDLAVDNFVSEAKFHELYFKDNPDYNKIDLAEILVSFDKLINTSIPTADSLTSVNPFYYEFLQPALHYYNEELSKHVTKLKQGLSTEIDQVYTLYRLFFLILVEKKAAPLRNKNFYSPLIKEYLQKEEGWSLPDEFGELLLTHLYDTVLPEDEFIQNYLSTTNNTKKDDIDILKHIVKNVLLKDFKSLEILEENLANFRKHKTLALRKFLSALKKLSSSDNDLSLVFSKKNIQADYDNNFYLTLITHFLNYKPYYNKLINEKAKNYDIEKVALLDRVIINLALCEIFHCKDIPTNVSINEYIEISKMYCSQHSTRFINAIIDGILALQEAAK